MKDFYIIDEPKSVKSHIFSTDIFELIRFKIDPYSIFYHRYFIRYLHEDYFSEIYKIGHEEYVTKNGIDVHRFSNYDKKEIISILFDKNLHLFDEINNNIVSPTEFNNYPIKYVKLPCNLKNVPRCYKTVNDKPIYYVIANSYHTTIDFNKYLYVVYSDRLFKEYLESTLSSITLDGNTHFNFEENNIKHHFRIPNIFYENKYCAYIDDEGLIAATESETDWLIKLLNIDFPFHLLNKKLC